MAVRLIVKGSKFCVQTPGFCTDWLPDTPANRYTMVVWLRWLRDKRGKPLFTLQELAPLVGSANRQAASQHVETFRACGEDFRDFVLRQRKVDEQVVAAVTEVVRQRPLAGPTELASPVNERLGRQDLSAANMRAALAQIPCTVVLEPLRRQVTVGQAHYKEEALLEELMAHGSAKAGPAATAGLVATDRAMILSDPTAIRKLVTPDVPLEHVPNSLAWITVLLALYYWNVPLSVLGRWVGVHKTTVLRWLAGLAVAVWPILYQWILDKVAAGMVYIDEKWIKIQGRWHYWYVVLDRATELPVLAVLLPSRSRWACRWVGLMLRRIQKVPRVVITDGLLAYHSLIELLKGARHVLCRFHHQQGVTVWLKKHFTDAQAIAERKAEMKALLQTTDKRTVRRRLQRLKEKAAAWGIGPWVATVAEKLPSLICSIGSVRLPATTNAIERFFRAFNRFYKTRGGFHSVSSAKRELILFLVAYLFMQRDADGKAPIEAIVPEAPRMPLYRLLNDPLRSLGELRNVKPEAAMADFLLTKATEA